MKGVEILKPGLYTTIQDLGRFGFSEYGVPIGGAMDQNSFLLANGLLNNDPECAVVEWSLIPLVLQFHEDAVVSCTGASMYPKLNNQILDSKSVLEVKKGDVLSFNTCKYFMYGYVGIENGFQTDMVMNSRSFYKGITDKHKLEKGDILPFVKTSLTPKSNSNLKTPFNQNEVIDIDAFPGIEYNRLSEREQENLATKIFTVSNIRSRMAMQLQERLDNELATILTAPVLPGTVQLTPSGQLIVLMRDCQTTGGYPRVLQLKEDAIGTMAQIPTGNSVRFKVVEF